MILSSIKEFSYQFRNSHSKDNTVSLPFYLYNGNPYTQCYSRLKMGITKSDKATLIMKWTNIDGLAMELRLSCTYPSILVCTKPSKWDCTMAVCGVIPVLLLVFKNRVMSCHRVYGIATWGHFQCSRRHFSKCWKNLKLWVNIECRYHIDMRQILKWFIKHWM